MDVHRDHSRAAEADLGDSVKCETCKGTRTVSVLNVVTRRSYNRDCLACAGRGLDPYELLKVYMALVLTAESVSFIDSVRDYRPEEQRPTEEQTEALERIEKEVRNDERFGL